jgi:hypothetical protein
VERRVPKVPVAVQDRMLLVHFAGLPLVEDLVSTDAKPDDVWLTRPLLRAVLKYGPTIRCPVVPPLRREVG